MSKVKISDEQFSSLMGYVNDAQLRVQDAEANWGTNFDNLYNNIVTSGFLDRLYEDAKSEYYSLAKWGKVGVATVTAIALQCTLIPPPFGFLLTAITLVFGAINFINDSCDPHWIESSKNAFVQLLLNCAYGYDDGYVRIVNLMTKLDTVKLNLQQIITKINTFQTENADLNAAATDTGVTIKLAADNTTVLDVETSVTIDGETMNLSVSEAMNAFYTYETSVINAEMEAEYIKENYGIEVDYNDLIAKANGFMTGTIKSGLYSHSFVDGVLPTYTPDDAAAIQKAAGSLGFTTENFQSVLGNNKDLFGDTGLYGGLLGAAFLGKLIDAPSGSQGNDTPTDPNPSGQTGTPGTSYPTGGTYPSGGGATVVVPPTPDPGTTVTVTEPETNTETTTETEVETDTEIVNDIEIVEIEEEELPDALELDLDVDFDERARENYELGLIEGYEDIDKVRMDIINRVNEAFDNGNLDALKEELKKYGFSESDIESIILNRDLLVTSIVTGAERELLADIAAGLAKDAGVEDFTSIYSDTQTISDLESGLSRDLIYNLNVDDRVVTARTELANAQTKYEESVTAVQESYKVAEEAQKAMLKTKEEYTKEYGEDTTKWPEEKVKEYNESIEKYNESVKDLKDKNAKASEAKDNYDEANKNLRDTKKDVLKKIREGNSVSEETVNPGIPNDTPADGIQPGSDIGISNEDAFGMLNGEIPSNPSTGVGGTGNPSAGGDIGVSNEDALAMLNGELPSSPDASSTVSASSTVGASAADTGLGISNEDAFAMLNGNN